MVYLGLGTGIGSLDMPDTVEVFGRGGAFEPYVIHYAETFMVRASVGAYGIRPTGNSRAPRFATLNAPGSRRSMPSCATLA